MSFSASTQGRFSSISVMRGSETPRSERPSYISPTFKSNVFGNLEDNLNSSASAYDSYSELKMAAKKRVNRVERYSHILPTVNEWAPKAGDINNPDAHKQGEIDAINIAKKKAELENARLREHKEKLTLEVREQLQENDKKFQQRLDHKRPNPEARQEYKAAESEYWTETADQLNRMKESKTGYARDLQVQMHKKSVSKQFELENQKKDVRTGFEFRPRKEYDMQEYKDVLKQQVAEKLTKKDKEKSAKDSEKQERLKELQNQERMIEHFKEQVNLKKSGLSETNNYPPTKYESAGANSKNQATPTIVEVKLTRPQTSQDFSRVRGSQTRTQTAGDEKKADWELASLALLKKKEEQDDHLRGLKEQMTIKTIKKDVEANKKLEEERAITGFDLNNHRAKITVKQVAEVLKTQMKEKEDVKNKEAKTKKTENESKRQEYKAEERVAWQQYEEYVQKKMEMFNHYKKDHANHAPIKKNKGLMTVKI